MKHDSATAVTRPQILQTSAAERKQHMKISHLILTLCGLALGLASVQAQAPNLINYQGRVLVGNVNFDGSGQFKFALVNATGTTTYWSNNGTSVNGSEPTAAVTLTVTKGLYSVLLGDTSIAAMTTLPASAFMQADLRLRVWFNDGINGSQRLAPDQRLAPAAYLAASSVTTASIADAAIIGSKIATGTVTGTQIATNTLDASRFAVPGAPNAGQVLGFNGSTLTWTAPGGGVFSLNGTNAYYNGGNVGMGTNSPAAKLELRTITGTYGLLHSDGTIAFGSYIGSSGSGANGGWLGTQSNHALHFFVNNGSPRMTVDTTGNVGVGTFTPASKFTVLTPSGGTLKVGLEHTDGTVRLGTYAEPGNGGWFGTLSNHPLNFFVNDGLPSMTITSIDVSMVSGPGTVTVGTPNGESGTTIKRSNNRADIRFDGASLKLVAGVGSGPPGSNNGVVVDTAGNVGVGTATPGAKLDVNGTIRTKILTILGADVAEPFDVAETDLPKGTVVVIDAERRGGLKRSAREYDTAVAGIVSGANGINSGIILSQPGVNEGGQNVAISGRVYVQADTSSGPIQPGDLLTTSRSPGRAMKVRDYRKAQGAVLGKAMSPLAEGEGMVLVLVTLQ
jgi:hypothetical protein